MNDQFYRMKRMPPYVIAEVNAMRHAARLAGQDIIDLGMGNPDQPPPQHVIDKLCEVAAKPDAHGYSQSKGIPGLRRAQAGYYARRFGVELDPENEVVVTMGSKEGLSSLATAIIAPGDVVLAPNPSYPIHTFGFIIAGATIRSVPTTPDEHYWESLERAMNYTVPRPSVLVVSYPSNPTAETVELPFYERLVAWAKENQVWIVSDLAYSELYYDGNPTVSILQVKGAKDVAIVRVEQLAPLPAEELAQDALVCALEHWPAEGVPDNPGAWLMSIAERRGIDGFRRAETLHRKTQELARTGEADAMPDLVVLRPEGLYCPRGDFHIDPWKPVPRAVIARAPSGRSATRAVA